MAGEGHHRLSGNVLHWETSTAHGSGCQSWQSMPVRWGLSGSRRLGFVSSQPEEIVQLWLFIVVRSRNELNGDIAHLWAQPRVQKPEAHRPQMELSPHNEVKLRKCSRHRHPRLDGADNGGRPPAPIFYILIKFCYFLLFLFYSVIHNFYLFDFDFYLWSKGGLSGSGGAPPLSLPGEENRKRQRTVLCICKHLQFRLVAGALTASRLLLIHRTRFA